MRSRVEGEDDGDLEEGVRVVAEPDSRSGEGDVKLDRRVLRLVLFLARVDLKERREGEDCRVGGGAKVGRGMEGV